MLIIRTLSNPKLLIASEDLPHVGILKQSKDGLIYLDIDDKYIHKLFPLLDIEAAEIPPYFGNDLVGAHISVIYPDEIHAAINVPINSQHEFTISSLVKAIFPEKIYYVLFVNAPTLQKLRLALNLSDRPVFKTNLINFHITIAVEQKG